MLVMNNYDNNHKVDFMRTTLCYLHFNYKDKNLFTKKELWYRPVFSYCNKFINN